jgi:hypothetical protein
MLKACHLLMEHRILKVMEVNQEVTQEVEVEAIKAGNQEDRIWIRDKTNICILIISKISHNILMLLTSIHLQELKLVFHLVMAKEVHSWVDNNHHKFIL